MKKFFIDKSCIENNIARVSGEEFLHLSKVLRSKEGEEVELLTGEDCVYFGEITEINKKCAMVKITRTEICQGNPKAQITVFQGLAKGEKFDLIVQKLTELGISEFVPFESEFTIAKNNPNKKERLEKISKEACKQCGRSIPLKICDAIKLKSINLSQFDLVIFLNETKSGGKTLRDLNSKILSAKNIAIIVGAEGGFSSGEIEFLSKFELENISLGKRILRTETASIAVSAYISFLLNN